jgi:hypothetical protein
MLTISNKPQNIRVYGHTVIIRSNFSVASSVRANISEPPSITPPLKPQHTASNNPNRNTQRAQQEASKPSINSHSNNPNRNTTRATKVKSAS